jgi:hypothetical protein
MVLDDGTKDGQILHRDPEKPGETGQRLDPASHLPLPVEPFPL